MADIQNTVPTAVTPPSGRAIAAREFWANFSRNRGAVSAGIVVLVLPASSAVFLLFFAAFSLIVLGVIGIVRAFTFGREVLKATDSPAATPRVA